MGEITVEKSAASALDDIYAIYPLAFPEEELRPLVRALFPLDAVLSFSAIRGGETIGHGLFSISVVDGGEGRGALLGPLAVHPDHQQSGVGRAIIEAGCARLAEMSVGQVFVLGDPNYYGRFGFAPERGVETPFPIPDEWREAWASKRLTGPHLSGVLRPPEPWMRPELWA
ncbi:MAG: N-acetyltransferase [Pseudomonadota bacterium]